MWARASSALSTLLFFTLMENARTMWLQNSTEMPQLCRRTKNPKKDNNKDWRMISAGEVVHEDMLIKAGTKCVQVNDTRSQWSARNEDPAKCKYKHQCSKLNHLGGSYVGQISTNIYKYLVHKIHHYFDALNTSLMYIKQVPVFCNPILSNKIARFNLLYCVKVKETANVSKNP